MKKVVIASVLFAAGCTQSSGVMQLGPDTYTVSNHAAPVMGGASAAKKLSLKEANEYCSSQGKNILVTNISTGASDHLPGGTADITFRCLSDNDKELVRPTYEKPADIVIKNK